jgi:hypothetical protein
VRDYLAVKGGPNPGPRHQQRGDHQSRREAGESSSGTGTGRESVRNQMLIA